MSDIGNTGGVPALKSEFELWLSTQLDKTVLEDTYPLTKIQVDVLKAKITEALIFVQSKTEQEFVQLFTSMSLDGQPAASERHSGAVAASSSSSSSASMVVDEQDDDGAGIDMTSRGKRRADRSSADEPLSKRARTQTDTQPVNSSSSQTDTIASRGARGKRKASTLIDKEPYVPARRTKFGDPNAKHGETGYHFSPLVFFMYFWKNKHLILDLATLKTSFSFNFSNSLDVVDGGVISDSLRDVFSRLSTSIFQCDALHNVLMYTLGKYVHQYLQSQGEMASAVTITRLIASLDLFFPTSRVENAVDFYIAFQHFPSVCLLQTDMAGGSLKPYWKIIGEWLACPSNQFTHSAAIDVLRKDLW